MKYLVIVLPLLLGGCIPAWGLMTPGAVAPMLSGVLANLQQPGIQSPLLARQPPSIDSLVTSLVAQVKAQHAELVKQTAQYEANIASIKRLADELPGGVD